MPKGENKLTIISARLYREKLQRNTPYFRATGNCTSCKCKHIRNSSCNCVQYVFVVDNIVPFADVVVDVQIKGMHSHSRKKKSNPEELFLNTIQDASYM